MSNIFEQATQPVTPASQGGEELVTKLASITNETGEPKYADLPTALDALKASQDFIPTLKNQVNEKDREIATLREQIAKSQGVQEALERFAAPQQQAQPVTPVATTTDSFGQADIESLVQNAFQSYTAKTQAEKNLEQVQNTLAQSYGDKAVEHIQNKAKELNTTAESLTEMAKNNPTMALQLLGAPKVQTGTMSYGSTNTAGFAAPQVESLSTSLGMMPTNSQQKDYMAKIQADVYRELGIEI